jgi:hypothetical protein
VNQTLETHVAQETAPKPEVWQTFATQRYDIDSDQPVVEKVSSLYYPETGIVTGNALRRHFEMQQNAVDPPVSQVQTVGVFVVNPNAPQQYTYLRLLPGAADCYHIVSNETGAVANVADHIPLRDLDLMVPAGSTLHLSIRARDGVEDGEPTPESSQLLDLFDTCRAAAKSVVPEAIVRPVRTRGFGARVLRWLGGRAR